MDTIPSSLSVTISKLTELLQLALNPPRQENANSMSGAILELIAHTTHLSILTTNFLDEYKDRERCLRECLSDMSCLVKVQQKKLQKVRPTASTASVATSTDEGQCQACIELTNANSSLSQQLVSLQTTVESLQGKLVQSKCLLQAQQVIIDDHEFTLKQIKEGPRRNVHAKPGRSMSPGPVTSVASAAEPWNDVFADSQHQKDPPDDLVLRYRRGMPPRLPGHNHRYDGSPGAESEPGSKQGEGKDDEAERAGTYPTVMHPNETDGTDGQWNRCEDPSYLEERPDRGWPEGGNGARLEEGEEGEPSAEEGSGGEHDQSYRNSSFDESFLEDEDSENRNDDDGDHDDKDQRYEEEEEWGEEVGAHLHPRCPTFGEYRHDRYASHVGGERSVPFDDAVPSADVHKQRHPLCGITHARAEEEVAGIGGGWPEDHESSVEDSFSLIRDFYDVNFS